MGKRLDDFSMRSSSLEDHSQWWGLVSFLPIFVQLHKLLCTRREHPQISLCFPILQILEEWFGRTVICSCVKLSYDHAQSMIESPGKVFSPEELPPVSPQHSVAEIQQAVLNLHQIAQQLRKQRFVDGALRLDQVSQSSPRWGAPALLNNFPLCSLRILWSA